MFDHVPIRVSDLEASERLYRQLFELLGVPPPTQGEGFVDWNDVSIAQASPERPLTRGAHAAFGA